MVASRRAREPQVKPTGHDCGHWLSELKSEAIAAPHNGRGVAEMPDGDLTPRQLAVLIAVAQNEGVSQTALVDRTGIDRSTLAEMVRRMQRKGLLQRRRRKEDARAYAVKLTDEGHRVLRAAEPLSKRVDERILGALPNRQRGQFIDDLMSIIETLQKLSSQSSQAG